MFPEFPFAKSELPLTLVELLRLRAKNQAKTKAFSWLADGLDEDVSDPKYKGYLTYEDLDFHARALAGHLQQQPFYKIGERVLLLYPPGLEFICAFFGCLYAGLVAVPVYPPRPNRSLERLQTIVDNAGAALALTCNSVWSLVERQLPQNPSLALLPWIQTDTTITAIMSEIWKLPELTTHTIAFLQYTSGSTSMPKGVMVSHGNIIHNEWMTQQFFHHNANTRVLGWLPLYHDMGLIGNLLQPLFLGTPCFLMPALIFLQRPIRWLQAISKWKITTSGGPNFAYDLCLESITPELLDNLDLSSWTLAFNGAEPVRADTLENFSEAFAQCGFKSQVFYPCYGLAETTLISTGGIPQTEVSILKVSAAALRENKIEIMANDLSIESSHESQALVSSGRALDSEGICIVNPESLQTGIQNQIGEIWIKGPHVAKGYWASIEQSKNVFQAFTAEGHGPYLRTGDLGFLHQQQLYVTGRHKDLIIIRGRNYYPQDIEFTVEMSNPLIRKNSSAAFALDTGDKEHLVVVAEIERSQIRKPENDPSWQNLASSIRRAVIEQHEIPMSAIYFLKPFALPKTSSGKVRRIACRKDIESDRMEFAHPPFYYN